LAEERSPPFGALLRRFRLTARLSQELLAERGGVSVETVSALERGTRKAPHRDTVVLLCEGLELSRSECTQLEAAAKSSRIRSVPRSAADGTPNNLVHATTSFHGRQRELVDLRELLGTRRVITLHGPGGAGKSRLAVELAREELRRRRFVDGIWLVELAALTDGQAVELSTAGVLCIAEDKAKPLLDRLVAALRNARVLLVLDNCEHVIEACATLAHRLCETSPSVTVLATSREPLEIPGELVYPVDPLGLPPENPSPVTGTLQQLAGSSAAVRLFLDRVEDVARHTVSPTERDDVATVAQICNRLDGLPLALELAAARAGQLSLREIASGLGERFALLSRGKRTAMPRHQTLRGLLDWSYGHLTTTEQQLFRRLGAFAGQWTLDAAEAVCGSDVSPEDVLHGVASLASKSLVAVVRAEDGSVRYRLLQSIRSYARLLLTELGEVDRLAQRHASYFRDRAIRAEATWRMGYSARPSDEFSSVLEELPEIGAALSWSIGERKALGLGIELTTALIELWLEYGFHMEALRRIDEAAKAVGQDTAPRLVVPLRFAEARVRTYLHLSGAEEADEDPVTVPTSLQHPSPAWPWLQSFNLSRTYHTGDVVFRQHDAPIELFYITSGWVSLTELGVTAGPGEFLGEVAFLSPTRRRMATAVCATNVTARAIGRRDLLDLYRKDLDFRTAILQVFGRHLLQDLEILRSRR
jgi:predicted ATPase/DNA-binding XRE family transcriptional regulator